MANRIVAIPAGWNPECGHSCMTYPSVIQAATHPASITSQRIEELLYTDGLQTIYCELCLLNSSDESTPLVLVFGWSCSMPQALF